ncbi:MAG: sulfatase-like hydrolase/transferase [Planctomycetota bacterium]
MRHALNGLLFAMALLGSCLVCVADESARPNIVFILVDDTGWNALDVPADPEIPGSGSSYYQTPHTSKLALSGIRFSMAYSPAPTCGPSRTSIQYGLTPSTVGKFAEKAPTNLPPARDAMIRRLKLAFPGYRAAHFGKWHQRTRTPEDIGYDESDGQTMNAEGNKCPPNDPKLTFSLAKKTKDFITRQVKEERPFFVQVSFYANHLKYMALRKTIQQYEARKNEATQYQNSPLWAAMNEDLDTAVGSIVDTVDALGIRDNTYFIYTADNGFESKVDQRLPAEQRTFHKAHPLLSHKYMISEGGLRVPFVVSGPGIPAGATSREPVVGWDIMPTVLDMARAKEQIPDNIEGGSLLAHCSTGGNAPIKRRDPFMVFRYTKTTGALDIAIMQDGYKLLRELRSEKEHLWSLWEDLGEQENLISKEPGKAAQLRANLDGYFARLGWDQEQHLNQRMPRKKRKGN